MLEHTQCPWMSIDKFGHSEPNPRISVMVFKIIINTDQFDHPDHLIVQGNVHRAKLWRDLASAWEGESWQGSHQDGIRLHSWGHAGLLSFVKMMMSIFIIKIITIFLRPCRFPIICQDDHFNYHYPKSQLHSWGVAGWFSSPKAMVGGSCFGYGMAMVATLRASKVCTRMTLDYIREA